MAQAPHCICEQCGAPADDQVCDTCQSLIDELERQAQPEDDDDDGMTFVAVTLENWNAQGRP